jgi:hypothetical protein
MNVEHLAARVHAEFLEMPGLRLTLSQAQRLLGLEPEVCAQVVDILVDRAFLRRRGAIITLAD